MWTRKIGPATLQGAEISWWHTCLRTFPEGLLFTTHCSRPGAYQCTPDPFCFGLPMPFLLRPGEPQPAARRSAPAGRHEGNGRPKTASPPATHAWLDCRGREHKQFLWRRTSLLRPDHHEECGRSQPQGCAAITETDGWWWGTEHLHPHLHPGG